MDSTYAIGNEIVDYRKFKTVTYALKDGKQGKMWFSNWKDSSVWVHKDFLWKDYYEYETNTHRA